MATDEQIVAQIIKKYGPMIDLREQPGVILDIIRRFNAGIDDGGLPPGGVPPTPPPGPTSFQGDDPTMRELMQEVLKISRAVAKTSKEISTIKGHLGI